MSIALVVTRGYSNGTLVGTIADVVPRGYIAGDASLSGASGGWVRDPYEYETRRRRLIQKEREEREKREEREEREEQKARDLAVEQARERGEAQKAAAREKRKLQRLTLRAKTGPAPITISEAEALIAKLEEMEAKARIRKAAIVLLLSG